MSQRHYVGQKARIIFTSDWHELLTGDLRPGQQVYVHYDPRRLLATGEIGAIGHMLQSITLCARFHPEGSVIKQQLSIPAGTFEIVQQQATTRAAVVGGQLDVPVDAEFVSLWFVGIAADGCNRLDNDYGSNFLFRFPSCDLATVEAKLALNKDANVGKALVVQVSASPVINRVSVRYSIVNAPDFPKRDFDLERGANSASGQIVWSGNAPVPLATSVVRFKIYYWIGSNRFKEDNAGKYFLAPEPIHEQVPPPPAELVEATLAFAVPTAT